LSFCKTKQNKTENRPISLDKYYSMGANRPSWKGESARGWTSQEANEPGGEWVRGRIVQGAWANQPEGEQATGGKSDKEW